MKPRSLSWLELKPSLISLLAILFHLLYLFQEEVGLCEKIRAWSPEANLDPVFYP